MLHFQIGSIVSILFECIITICAKFSVKNCSIDHDFKMLNLHHIFSGTPNLEQQTYPLSMFKNISI